MCNFRGYALDESNYLFYIKKNSITMSKIKWSNKVFKFNFFLCNTKVIRRNNIYLETIYILECYMFQNEQNIFQNVQKRESKT